MTKVCEICKQPAVYKDSDITISLPSKHITKAEIRWYCEEHIPSLCPDD